MIFELINSAQLNIDDDDKETRMYDFLLIPEEQALKQEARKFVREEITGDFLRKMDKDEISEIESGQANHLNK